MPEHASAQFDCARHSAGFDRQRVVAIGEIDLATGSRLTSTLRDAQDHAHHVVLDLGRITFIDAGGVRILLAAAARARAAAGSFSIARPTLPVGRLLGLLDVDHVLAAVPPFALDSRGMEQDDDGRPAQRRGARLDPTLCSEGREMGRPRPGSIG